VHDYKHTYQIEWKKWKYILGDDTECFPFDDTSRHKFCLCYLL